MFIDLERVDPVDEEAGRKTEQGQRFTNATPRPWRQFDQDANATEIMGADGPTVCTMEQCGGIREISEAEDNAALIVEAVNSYDARARLLQTSLDLLNDVYNSRASQRFSAIGLSRIKSHITELQSALNPRK